mmetsp:Transcript_148995/g.379056  ORF Transcript_148995/g.379056 Transcript_148995/m.379056 type:complete len:237 (+) Transcript_148995:563-1273(+)
MSQILGDLDDAHARDPGQDRANQCRRVNDAILHAEEVCGPGLFDIAVLDSVEVQDLVEALLLRLHARNHTRCVVANGLGATLTTWCGPVMLVRHLQSDGRHAALEIWADGACVDAKGELRSWCDTQDAAAPPKTRTDVQSAFASRRNPPGIGRHNRLHSVDEHVLWNSRHSKSGSAGGEAIRVAIRAEDHDVARVGPLRLHALEDPLPVVQHARSGGHLDVAVGLELSGCPRVSLL